MKIKEQSGITLFILIITVVIMLMLAGTVAMSISGYGEVKRLKNLVGDLEILQEKVDIYYEKNGELPSGSVVNSGVVSLLGDSRNLNDNDVYYKIDLQLLENMTLNYGKENFEGDYFIVNEKSHNVYYYAGVTVNDKQHYGKKDVLSSLEQVQFGVQDYEWSSRVNAEVTNGNLDIQLQVYADVSNEKISKYKFKLDNGEWTEPQESNTYVFHNLAKNEKYKVSMIIIDNENNEIYATNNEEEIFIEKLPINLTADGKLAGTYSNPLIPAGFIPINVNNAIWQSSDGYKNGLVITDQVDANGISIGNEFVWVPVDGTNVVLERKNWEKSNGNYGDYSETLPDTITTSVQNNGGFYIARYEAGKEKSNNTDVLVSKKGAAIWNNISYTEALTKANNMYSSENYGGNSTLIYGAQWDATLQFITGYNVGENGYDVFPSNSTGVGNYSGTSGGDTTTATPATSGILEVFKQKNIYDMAGNVQEWTNEKYGTDSVKRGGSYSNSSPTEYPAGYRNHAVSSSSTSDTGFRVAMCLN